MKKKSLYLLEKILKRFTLGRGGEGGLKSEPPVHLATAGLLKNTQKNGKKKMWHMTCDLRHLTLDMWRSAL